MHLIKNETIKYQISIILTLFIGFVSCNDNCADKMLNTRSLELEYDCVNTKYQMDINLTESYIIINNQSDFDELVTGSCRPEIDFSTYDLIIGKKGLSSGNTSIGYELIENCKNGNQILTVTFNQNETTEAPNLTYHGLIPKLGEGQELSVEINID